MLYKYRGIILILVGTVAALIWLFSLPVSSAAALIQEHGPIETMAVIGYGICAVTIFIRSDLSILTRILISLIFLTLDARELDLDKKYFTVGLFRSSQYLRDNVSGLEKLVSLGILLLISASLIILIYYHGRTSLNALRLKAPWALSVFIATVIAVISKTLDGIARKLEPFGIELSETLTLRIETFEEVIETALPLLLLVAILNSPALSRRIPSTSGSA